MNCSGSSRIGSPGTIGRTCGSILAPERAPRPGRTGTIRCCARRFPRHRSRRRWATSWRESRPQSVERARQNLKAMGANNALKLRAAGMKIVNGSDTGQTRFFIGWAGQLEFEHWVLMGLTPSEAIVAATRDSADAAHINTGHGGGGQVGRFHRPRCESSREHRQLATDQQGLPPGPGGGPRRVEGQVAGGVESRHEVGPTSVRSRAMPSDGGRTAIPESAVVKEASEHAERSQHSRIREALQSRRLCRAGPGVGRCANDSKRP